MAREMRISVQLTLSEEELFPFIEKTIKEAKEEIIRLTLELDANLLNEEEVERITERIITVVSRVKDLSLARSEYDSYKNNSKQDPLV